MVIVHDIESGAVITRVVLCSEWGKIRIRIWMHKRIPIPHHNGSAKGCILFRFRRKMIASWWRHQVETFSALLAICAGNSPVTGEFPTQRPVTRSFDVFFDLRLNKRLSKKLWGRWFEMPSRSLYYSVITAPQCSTHISISPSPDVLVSPITI